MGSVGGGRRAASVGGQLALAAFALAGAALLALAMVLALSARPAAAAGGGTVAGTVRSSSGTTLAGIRVDAFNGTYGNLLATTTSDPAGAYQLTGLPSYAVVVRFSDPAGTWSTQYFDRVATFASATRLTVPASTTATADAALVPRPGIVTGRITSSTGPLTGISVTVLDPVTNATVATTTSNATGTYKFTGVPTGTYLVRFTDPTGTHGTEYFPNAPTSGTAIPLTLTATTGAVADGELAPTGAISGRLTAGRVALPAVWAVLVTPQPLTIAAAALTDANGSYTIDHVTAGTYKLVFVDTTWTAGSSTGYRPIVYPDLDGGDPTTQLATIAAGADQTIPAGGTLTGRDGHLRGADCTPTIDGHPTNLTGTTWTGKKLMGCNLSGAALDDAVFDGADLTGASLRSAWGNRTSFAGASLLNADLTNTYLWDAVFDGAQADGAILRNLSTTRSSFVDASMVGTDLRAAGLTDADIDGLILTGADMTRVGSGGVTGTPVDLPAPWVLRGGFLAGPGAWTGKLDASGHRDLSGLDLHGVDLTGAYLDNTLFGGTDLTGAILTDAETWEADFSGATLTGVRTGGLSGVPIALPPPWRFRYTPAWGYLLGPGADLTNADLRYVNESGLDLTGATMAGADLRWSVLDGVQLVGADLSTADLRWSVLVNAELDGVDLSTTDLHYTTVSHSSAPAALPPGFFTYSVYSGRIYGPTVIQPGIDLWFDISGRDLSAADLHGAYVFSTAVGTSLVAADLHDARILGADLTGADLGGANLAGTTWEWVDLTNANLGGATGTPTSLLSVTFSNTICPTGVNSDGNGGTCVGQGW